MDMPGHRAGQHDIRRRSTAASFATSVGPVSYTHLDVYKRQVYDHPNQECYPGQQFFVVQTDIYVYLVPFVEKDGQVFLKTIIPSRKAKRKYRKQE